MRLLDLFCCQGGASMGYHRAGFDVVGVDIVKQPRYPFPFIQADALEVAQHGWYWKASDGNYYGLNDFDAVHASPPCQKYTVAQNAAKNADAHPDLVGPVRDLLLSQSRPWVLENVIGAPMTNAAVLCGLSFGLQVRRHRLFETSFFLMTPPCQCQGQDYFVIFGHEVHNRRHGLAAGRKNNLAAGRKAMGIDWMTRGGLSEAIPPAYTQFIGAYLLAACSSRLSGETKEETK